MSYEIGSGGRVPTAEEYARMDKAARMVPLDLRVLAARLTVIRDLDPPMNIITLNQLIDEITAAAPPEKDAT